MFEIEVPGQLKARHHLTRCWVHAADLGSVERFWQLYERGELDPATLHQLMTTERGQVWRQLAARPA